MLNMPQWLEYLEKQIGFVLPVAQHRWLENAIHTTAKTYDISVNELWLQIQNDQTLRQALFDTVLIGESRFFRHLPSIEFIVKQAVNTIHTIRDMSIWSVGCSQGQEVWSVAMALSYAGVDTYHILGTDLSTTALVTAQQAIYTERQKATLPEQYHHFMQPSTSDTEQILGIKKWKVVDRLQYKVSFALYNLLSAQQATNSQIVLHDVLICQNVLIYFSSLDQHKILNGLVQRCRVGGHIVLAPNEAMTWQHINMQKVAHSDVNAWKKISLDTEQSNVENCVQQVI